MPERQAVVFGAGKMACGLLGQLLSQSGFRIQFIVRRPEVIDAINRRQGYSLIISGDRPRRVTIDGCSALPLEDRTRVTDAVAGADIVMTAVGIDHLADVTPPIGEGLWLRSQTAGGQPLNVIACENLPGAGAYLRHQVVSGTPLENAMAAENAGGFSAALTRRIMTGGEIEHGELTFTADSDADLIVDTHGIKAPFPELQGVSMTGEFSAMVMRKLFTLNCAQAIAAYLGHREGCEYVHEAAAHPRVGPIVRGALEEARAALQAEFPHQAEAIDREVADAMRRIADPRLEDTVRRVGRDPRRKLSPRERLVGPARLANHHGLPCENLCRGIAAALSYHDPADIQATALREAIAREGIEVILTEDCGLLPHGALARAVKQRWFGLGPAGSVAAGSAVDLSGAAPLDEITAVLARELNQRYDPRLVREVVARVAAEFEQVRVWNFVPLLMRRRVCERLGEGSR